LARGVGDDAKMVSVDDPDGAEVVVTEPGSHR